MNQRGKVCEVAADVTGRKGGRSGCQAQHTGKLVTPHPPDVEVGYSRTAGFGKVGDHAAEFLSQGMVHLAVEQDTATFTEQTDGPASNEHRTHQTHGWVQPRPAKAHATEQGDDGEHRSGGIGDDV